MSKFGTGGIAADSNIDSKTPKMGRGQTSGTDNHDSSSSYQYRRQSAGQVRLEKLQKYKLDKVEEVNRVPKLLDAFEKKVERADNIRNTYLKKRNGKGSDRVNFKA